jgi:hypothetical protein
VICYCQRHLHNDKTTIIYTQHQEYPHVILNVVAKALADVNSQITNEKKLAIIFAASYDEKVSRLYCIAGSYKRIHVPAASGRTGYL